MKTYFAGQFDIAVIGAGHAGIEAALAAARLGLRTPLLHRQPGRGGQHALQPGHWRHGEGPSGPGAGRPGGRDGQSRRPGLHPVPAAQPEQGPRCLVPPGPGRPAGGSENHEAHPGKAGEPVGEAVGNRGHFNRGRRGVRGGHPHRGGLPGEGRHRRHRHSPGRADRGGGGGKGLGSRRPVRRPAPDPGVDKAGADHPPVQDWHAPPGQCPQRGFFQDGAPGGGRRQSGLLLPDRDAPGKPGGVLADLHQ